MKTCYIDLKLLYNELEDIEKMLIPLLTIIGNKGIEYDVLIYSSEPYEKEAQMNFTDAMLEKIYGKKVIDECELETLRLDNARLREENENLKVSFSSDTKLLNEKEDEIFNLHNEIEIFEKRLKEYKNKICNLEDKNNYYKYAISELKHDIDKIIKLMI